MKYYLISGEASGDLHGSNLIRSILKLEPNSTFRCWGGDLIEKAGGKLVVHYRDLAFMGFFEVLRNIGTIRNNFRFCRHDILDFNPDVVILIDYPGFNLRMAEFAKKNGFRVFYYISPQVWAWNRSRVKKIKKYVDRMFVILPFEKDFYYEHGCDVDFVGHPLLDAMEDKSMFKDRKVFLTENELDERPIVAILPGSRKQEISRMLPTMSKMALEFPAHQFVIAGAPSVPVEFYNQFSTGAAVKILSNKTYNLLNNAHAALVTSGTATLETGLFKVPEVVCYRGNFFSYLLARMVIKVKYISLVNLIMGKLVVKELIQGDFNSRNLKRELKRLLSEASYRLEMLKNLDELTEKLGGSGASEKTASLMINYLRD